MKVKVDQTERAWTVGNKARCAKGFLCIPQVLLYYLPSTLINTEKIRSCSSPGRRRIVRAPWTIVDMGLLLKSIVCRRESSFRYGIGHASPGVAVPLPHTAVLGRFLILSGKLAGARERELEPPHFASIRSPLHFVTLFYFGNFGPVRKSNNTNTNNPGRHTVNCTQNTHTTMLGSTASTMLRAGAAGRTLGGLQPALLRNTAAGACPYAPFSAISPKLSQSPSRPLSTVTTKPTHSTLIIRSRQQQQQLRNQSTLKTTPQGDAAVDANAAEAAAQAQTAAHAGEPPLDWNTFFKLRKTRRVWQQVFSVVMALSGSAGGAIVLSSGVAESLVSQLPLDPLISLGLMTASFGALGWLAGPSIGTAIFNAIKRKYRVQMDIKESQFFARIKKHRVDPSAGSMRNPG